MRVQHLGSQSAQNVSIASFRLAWRNLLWTLFITRSNQELLADVPFILVGQLVQFALAALRGRPNLVSSVVAETWAHRKQLIEARRRFLALQQHGFRSFIKPGVFPLARPLAVLRRAN